MRPQRQATFVREEGRPRTRAVRKPQELMPADLAEDAVGRYTAGEPPRLIAVALDVPASRVYRLLGERGVLRSRSEARELQHARRRAAAEQERPTVEAPAGKRGKEWMLELKAQVLGRYAAGQSGPAIAP